MLKLITHIELNRSHSQHEIIFESATEIITFSVVRSIKYFSYNGGISITDKITNVKTLIACDDIGLVPDFVAKKQTKPYMDHYVWFTEDRENFKKIAECILVMQNGVNVQQRFSI